jgi:hypothetical protein
MTGAPSRGRFGRGLPGRGLPAGAGWENMEKWMVGAM